MALPAAPGSPAAEPPLSYTRPEASYLTWIDARGLLGADAATEREAVNPALHFRRHGVALTDGRQFGADGFVRLNFATTRDHLDEGLRRAAEGVRAAAAPPGDL